MVLQVSSKAKTLFEQTRLSQQIILEIDGIGLFFSSLSTEELWRIGAEGVTIGQSGLVVGGTIASADNRNYISLTGTTNNITQQLQVDKGGSGSVSRFNVELVDKNQELTQLFKPGNEVSDLVSREANVYVGLEGGTHPEDSIRIYSGVVTSQEAKQGSWRIGIDHPEFLKRQDLFVNISGKLTAAITDSDVELTLSDADVADLILPLDDVTCAVLINDEIMTYTGVDTALNKITGITRGQEGTTAVAHDIDDDVSSYYIIEGDPIDISLKMMLSRKTGNEEYKTDLEPASFVRIGDGSDVADAIFFASTTFIDDNGLVVGALVSVTGATNPANDITAVPITSLSTTENGTVVVVGGAGLVLETSTAALVSLRSQYDVYPQGAGCNMSPTQVDIRQHLDIAQRLSAELPDIKLRLDDTIVAKDFITEELYLPAGLYRVDRKGRASVAATTPPLVTEALPTFTEDNVRNANKLNMKRQLSKNFYNAFVYKFNPNPLALGDYKTGTVLFSQNSLNRIKTGTKSLTITSNGFQDDTETRNFITKQSRRFADRYQFAAESVDIEVLYADGFEVELADVVLFGSPGLQVVDTESGTREFTPRLMEVINKTMNLKTGLIKLRLLDTGFNQDGRYGVVSSSSFINTGATTTTLPLKPSFGSGEFDIERNKWTNLIGEEVKVRSVDFTFNETVRLLQFDSGSTDSVVVTPALSSAPLEGYILEVANYSTSTDSTINVTTKSIHVFFDPQVEVASGVSLTEFTVAPADIDKFFVDSIVRVHSADFTSNSSADTNEDDAVVTAIDGGTFTITVSRSLTFIPVMGDFVELIGFADEGLPYRQV